MTDSGKKTLKVAGEMVTGAVLAGPPGVFIVAAYEGYKAVLDTIVEHKEKMTKIQSSKTPVAIEHKK